MNIYINPLSDKGAPVLQAKASGSPISLLRFKRGSSVPLTVTLLGVTEAGNLRIGMKRRDRFESPLLAYAAAATPDEAEGSGETTPAGVRFSLMLHVNSEELDDALGVGAGDSVDVPGAVSALTEICWEEGETTRISDSVATVIANDIVRMNEDTPQSEQGAYPLPELLATKGWVNDLHAGAGQYGLVELESGTALEDGHYTAVALTAGGAIAVPRATASTHGTVKLGTSRALPDTTGVLPVGARTSDGGLAVDASGLSAYAIAKASGFSGTEEEWLASLKGEKGDKGDTGDVGPQGAPESLERVAEFAPGDSNAKWNYAVLAAGLVPSGRLKRISIQARPSGNPTDPIYLGIMQQQADSTNIDASTWTFLGGSTNAVTQQNGQPGIWEFADIQLVEGKPFALVGMAAADTGWNMATQVGSRSLARSADDTTSRLGASTVVNYIPQMCVTVEQSLGQQLLLHERDGAAHITAQERAAWNAKVDGATLNAHEDDSDLHLTDALKTAISNTAVSVSDMKRYRLVWFTSRMEPATVLSVEDATGHTPEYYMQTALGYADRGAFALPLGSHALLLYKGSYNSGTTTTSACLSGVSSIPTTTPESCTTRSCKTMCEHRPNEPWWAYIARWVVEQPRVLLSVIGIVAAGIFYYDLRSYMNYQQQVQNETVRVLTELTLRVENIEQRVYAKK